MLARHRGRRLPEQRRSDDRRQRRRPGSGIAGVRHRRRLVSALRPPISTGVSLQQPWQPVDNSDVQQQMFFTAGLFRRAFDGDHFTSHFSMGIAYDWMINDSFGEYAQSPFLGQWRGQIGYCLNARNEIGVWGTLRDRGSEKTDVFGETVLYRPLSQINLFWHHTFCSGANVGCRPVFPSRQGPSFPPTSHVLLSIRQPGQLHPGRHVHRADFAALGPVRQRLVHAPDRLGGDGGRPRTPTRSASA